MLCHEALEILEADSVGAWDDDPQRVDEARRHLAECDQCRAAWPRVAAWSRVLSAAMPDVAVPPHQASRLQALLPTSATVIAAPRARRGQRRWWIASTVTVAAMVVVAMLVRPTVEPLQLADLRPAVDAPLDALPEFSSGFAPRLPIEWQAFFQLPRNVVRGFPAAGHQSGQVGLVPFHFQSRRGAGTLSGRLLILPRDRFDASAQLSTRFSAANVEYFRMDDGTLAGCIVWREDDLVFACLMSSPAALQEFKRALSASRPIS